MCVDCAFCGLGSCAGPLVPWSRAGTGHRKPRRSTPTVSRVKHATRRVCGLGLSCVERREVIRTSSLRGAVLECCALQRCQFLLPGKPDDRCSARDNSRPALTSMLWSTTIWLASRKNMSTCPNILAITRCWIAHGPCNSSCQHMWQMHPNGDVIMNEH